MVKTIWFVLLGIVTLIFSSSFDLQKTNPQQSHHLVINDPINEIVQQKQFFITQKLQALNTKKKIIEQEKTQWGQQKIVYLTFDDGPTKYTPQILDILKQNDIKATFFLVGNYINGKETTVKRIKDDGDGIGLHSMTHNEKLLFLSPESYINEYKQEQSLLQSLGVQTNISRTPYGSKPLLTQPYRDQIFYAHMKLWDWTIDSNDWRYKDQTNLIINQVSSQIKRQHEVVLMHDHGYTVKSLPGIIKLFKDRGYTFQAYNPDMDFMVNFWNDTRL
ncbi:polysaccharide deacetylase family protein [Neobacillus ginsengisoli]|uniref:Peptidoglycan/xylan/chitin deacetylase (PgdA/CDA1 family) n=1 Tax=Neobacillus ginsengisoli TaxID=904295 RepID=A0ABT9Y1H3_9BACI|nr:polysaccharide deacetylase family protein [Neobacillus ginsengisoli]MDQ0201682.1 peptidoglycan/xylan/chitin deacetylase (PgdA/CDA1 family) [Neobacillus ginsengisoli]